jgi:hypothetical protein
MWGASSLTGFADSGHWPPFPIAATLLWLNQLSSKPGALTVARKGLRASSRDARPRYSALL